MKDWPDLLPHLLGHPPGAAGADGFGQSASDDILFRAQASLLRSFRIVWRKPTPVEAQAIAADPFLSRFAAFAVAVTWRDGMAGVVLERTWHGFPDPPQYALFFMRAGEVFVAGDFDVWPGEWVIEGG